MNALEPLQSFGHAKRSGDKEQGECGVNDFNELFYVHGVPFDHTLWIESVRLPHPPHTGVVLSEKRGYFPKGYTACGVGGVSGVKYSFCEYVAFHGNVFLPVWLVLKPDKFLYDHAIQLDFFAGLKATC